MNDSPLEYVEMQRAVARFTAAVPVQDTLTDYQFATYENAILGLCKKHKASAHLETLVKRLAVKYAVDFAELNRQARILAEEVGTVAQESQISNGKRWCNGCKNWYLLDCFYQRATGSYDTLCKECRKKKVRDYTRGRIDAR